MLDYKMTPYANISGKSGIKSYEIGDNYLIVMFTKPNKNGICSYKYTSDKINEANINLMINLAKQGEGLNSFISANTEIKYGYSESW